MTFKWRDVGTNCLIFALGLPFALLVVVFGPVFFTVFLSSVFGGPEEAGIIILLVSYIVGLGVGFRLLGIGFRFLDRLLNRYEQKRLRKQEEQQQREQEQQRLHVLKLAKEEEQKRQHEQEQQRQREQEESRFRALELADVDNMDPYEFEEFVGQLLKRRGYKTTVIGKAGDMGVDVVAQNEDEKYAVQVKHYSQPVSRRAVSDAVAGKDYYGCNAAMVVTNNYFTKGAVELARSTKCQLVNRDTLADWIVDLRVETTKEPKHGGDHTRIESEELSRTQMHVGVDPELLHSGIKVAGYHIEAGTRSFGSFAKVMVEEFGDRAKPCLKAWYNGMRNFPGAEEIAKEMDSPEEVDRLSEPTFLDAILSGKADEYGVVWPREGGSSVENEMPQTASSLSPASPVMPHAKLGRAIDFKTEEVNQHPLNQKALELLRSVGETPYPRTHLHILMLLVWLESRRPEEMKPFEYILTGLLALSPERVVPLLMGEEGGRQQMQEHMLEEVQTPMEMLEFLRPTLTNLSSPGYN